VNRSGPVLGIALVLCGLCAALGYVAGERSAAPAASGGKHLPRLIDQLGLRAEQVEQIDRLLTAHDAQVESLVERQREQLRGPLAESLDQTETKILAVLDETQRSQYLELTRD
jgi:hypothetical protein